MELELEVLQRAVVRSQAADALSQLPSTATDDKDIDDDIPVLVLQHYTCNVNIPTSCNCQDCENT